MERKNLPEDGKERHLWFSAKCEDSAQNIRWIPYEPYHKIFYRTLAGERIQVSIVDCKAECPGKWDDMEYLGIGIYAGQ